MGHSSLTGRRLGAVGVAVLLLLVVAEGWVPRLLPARADRPAPGAEGEDDAGDRAADAADRAGFDLDRAVEKVSHELAPLPGQPGALATGDASYSAVLDDTGFSFRPEGAASAFGLSLAEVRRGSESAVLDPRPWTGRENVASRSVAPGVHEWVTARDGEVEWDVVLDAPPPGTGPLTVAGRLGGTAGAPTRVEDEAGPAWRLDLDGGSSVRMDEMVVKDARGAAVYRALPRIADGRVELRVPSAVLDAAAYPLTIDPTLSAKTVVTPNGRGEIPSVAFGGSTYLVVYENLGPVGNRDIRGRRLDANGGLLGDIILVANSIKSERAPDVAWNGSTFLAVWTLDFSSTDSDVEARTVSTAGGLGELRNVSALSTVEDAAAVAANGSTFFVAWQDGRNATLDVFGARVNNSGTVLTADVNGIPVATSAKPDYSPDVAGNGTTFLVAYQQDFEPNDPDIRGRRVSNAGAALGSAAGFDISTSLDRQRSPAVASDGSQFLVVFEDETTTGSGAFDIGGARVNAAGVNQGVFPVSDDGGDQLQPSVAHNGVFLVVFWDRLSGPDFSDVVAARVQGNGTLSDPSGFAVAVTDSQEDFPAVTKGSGNQWGVAFEFGTQPQLDFLEISPK